MSYDRWIELMRELSRIVGSEELLDWDSTPLDGLLLNIDGYPASRSKLPWMTWSDWGWKAAVASMSDIAASGGRPLAVMYSVGVSSADEAREIALGVGEAARWAGVRVAKSDTNISMGERWIDVAVVGVAEMPVSRRGAKPGELLVQVGEIGYGFLAAAALEGRIDVRNYPRAERYTRRPTPPLHIGPSLGRCGASASIDNSDGWVASLYSLSRASGVKIVLDDMLVAEEALEVAEALRVDREAVLYSPEDYNLAVAASRESAECLLEACRSIGARCIVAGRVEEGSGVYFRERLLPSHGWVWIQS